MSVTIYHDDHFGGYGRYFYGDASTSDLFYYSMDASLTWDGRVSSLYIGDALRLIELADPAKELTRGKIHHARA
jgi:hypothetical protein